MSDASSSERNVLERIGECVRDGKADRATDIPPGSKGCPGVVELVKQALADGAAPQDILAEGLLPGMQEIGRRFAANEVFVPEVLIAARAMHMGFAVLNPVFAVGAAPRRGVFVIGTVCGDLHDIGKKLVSVVLESAGWQIEDLGTDCPTERFVEAVDRHPGCDIGLSALLTTTMVNMRDTVAALRRHSPSTVALVGGAPVTAEFARQIGAGGYAADPFAASRLLDDLVAALPS